jgi:SAM-dependent methyltransferase
MISYVIDIAEECATWDEICFEPCGIARLIGWSRRSVSEIPAPVLMAGGIPQRVLNRWRFHRPDIIEQPLAGIAIEWFLDPGPMRFATLAIVGAPQMTLPVRLDIALPDYVMLFDAETVLKRQDIYGSGPPYTELADQVRALFPFMTGKILDFGCGVGALVKELRMRGCAATGIEIERPALKEGLLSEVAQHIRFYKPPVLPFGADAFDTVTALEVLEHVPELEASLCEIARVAPKLILSVPDMSAIPMLHRHGVVPWHLLEFTHVNFFTEQSLRALLGRHYRDVEIARMTPQLINGTRYFLSLVAICNR